MSEEAKVVLSAVDEVSTPALKAAQSLKSYQSSVNSLAAGVQTVAMGVPKYASELGNAATKSAASMGTAQKAMSLVSSGLADIAGASPAAEAGIRVLDSAMFKMVQTGGSLSLGFLGIVAAAAAIGYAFKTTAENTRKGKEEMDGLRASTIAQIRQLETLDRVQKSVMGVGAADAGEKVAKLRRQIDDLTEAMRKNAAQDISRSTPKSEYMGMEGSVTVPASSDPGGGNAAQLKMAGDLRILQEELRKTQREQDALTVKSAKYKSVIDGQGNPLRTYINGLERSASAMESLLQITGSLEFNYEALAAGAEKAGISVNDAAKIMMAQNKAVENGVMSLAAAFGQTMGNAVSKGKDAWREGLKAMVGMVFDTATQVLIAAAIMNKGLSAALIPFSFGAILAMVAVVQGLKMIAMNALSSGASGLQASAPTNLGSATGSSGGISALAEGGGGRSISSASKEVVNNIEINLPVSAMDLSSVSDIQMKTLATKIGRYLAESAGQGQFSLVGA